MTLSLDTPVLDIPLYDKAAEFAHCIGACRETLEEASR